MENKELIKKWLNAEISPQERAVLESLPEYQEYNRIVESASRFRRPQFDEVENLHRLQERLKKSKPKKVRSLRLPVILKIAAVLVLLIASGWFIYYYSPVSYTTGIGEISVVELPDNSEVRLNALSKIKYYPGKWNGKRELSLEGEAFFDVERGSSFTVETSEGIVQVLGTSFNIKNRLDYFEVVCYEGSVKVIHSGREKILLPGEAYTVVENKLYENDAIPEEMPGWLTLESNFRAVPLKMVLSEMERQFGIQIEAENVNGEQLFTGSFSHSERETALKSVAIPLGLNYKIKGGSKVILYEE